MFELFSFFRKGERRLITLDYILMTKLLQINQLFFSRFICLLLFLPISLRAASYPYGEIGSEQSDENQIDEEKIDQEPIERANMELFSSKGDEKDNLSNPDPIKKSNEEQSVLALFSLSGLKAKNMATIYQSVYGPFRKSKISLLMDIGSLRSNPKEKKIAYYDDEGININAFYQFIKDNVGLQDVKSVKRGEKEKEDLFHIYTRQKVEFPNNIGIGTYLVVSYKVGSKIYYIPVLVGPSNKKIEEINDIGRIFPFYSEKGEKKSLKEFKVCPYEEDSQGLVKRVYLFSAALKNLFTSQYLNEDALKVNFLQTEVGQGLQIDFSCLKEQTALSYEKTIDASALKPQQKEKKKKEFREKFGQYLKVVFDKKEGTMTFTQHSAMPIAPKTRGNKAFLVPMSSAQKKENEFSYQFSNPGGYTLLSVSEKKGYYELSELSEEDKIFEEKIEAIIENSGSLKGSVKGVKLRNFQPTSFSAGLKKTKVPKDNKQKLHLPLRTHFTGFLSNVEVFEDKNEKQEEDRLFYFNGEESSACFHEITLEEEKKVANSGMFKKGDRVEKTVHKFFAFWSDFLEKLSFKCTDAKFNPNLFLQKNRKKKFMEDKKFEENGCSEAEIRTLARAYLAAMMLLGRKKKSNNWIKIRYKDKEDGKTREVSLKVAQERTIGRICLVDDKGTAQEANSRLVILGKTQQDSLDLDDFYSNDLGSIDEEKESSNKIKKSEPKVASKKIVKRRQGNNFFGKKFSATKMQQPKKPKKTKKTLRRRIHRAPKSSSIVIPKKPSGSPRSRKRKSWGGGTTAAVFGLVAMGAAGGARRWLNQENTDQEEEEEESDE